MHTFDSAQTILTEYNGKQTSKLHVLPALQESITNAAEGKFKLLFFPDYFEVAKAVFISSGVSVFVVC